MKNLLHNDDDLEKLEDLPHRSRIPLVDGWGRRKGRSYPHNKVHRFLESRVGKLWDDVFSEFCHLTWIKDEDKTLERLRWNVVFDTLMIADKVHFLEEGSGIPKLISDYRWRKETFYVHPTTKKLSLSPRKKKEERKQDETIRILGDYHQLLKIKGIWHEIKGTPVESDVVIIDGLHYTKVKKLPETKEMVSSVHLPLPQKFFGRKVLTEQPKYKKTSDGYYLIPKPTGYYGRYDAEAKIGSRDRMIETNNDASRDSRYFIRRKLANSVKITVHRQLSSKELKKRELKNDFILPFTEPCSVCGNMGDGECFHNKS